MAGGVLDPPWAAGLPAAVAAAAADAAAGFPLVLLKSARTAADFMVTGAAVGLVITRVPDRRLSSASVRVQLTLYVSTLLSVYFIVVSHSDCVSADQRTEGIVRPTGGETDTCTVLTDCAVAGQPSTYSCKVLRAVELLPPPAAAAVLSLSRIVAAASAVTCTANGQHGMYHLVGAYGVCPLGLS
jgi:hypothetical protein